MELNRRIQQQNAAPLDFPAFVREGFNVKASYCIRPLVILCCLLLHPSILAGAEIAAGWAGQLTGWHGR